MRLRKLIFLFSLIFFIFTPFVFGSWATFNLSLLNFDATLGSLKSANTDFAVSFDPSFTDTRQVPYGISTYLPCNNYNDVGECTDNINNLCPYLALTPKDGEDTEIGFTQNNLSLRATGALTHPDDENDNWNLLIKSPCFEGECPADYDSSVNGEPLVQSLKGQTFKCNLRVDSDEAPILVQNYLKRGVAFAANNKNIIEVSAILTGELPACTADCFSNVLFFPGLMGSKLYEKGEGGSVYCGPGITGSECFTDNELWFSTSDSSQAKLSLDVAGKSIFDIFTKNDTQKLDSDTDERGVLEEIFGLNTYKSFLADLKNWKQDGTIKDYAFIPYDWRFSLEDIITNGAIAIDGNLSYKNTQNFSESFILKKLEDLQKTSKSGKVTIIAHSNGGLVTKALVQKLKDTGNPLYDKIDKIIFVAVPQLGTPSAFINLLHGSDTGPGGFVMSNERSRQLAENMPTVYNLLPSASYFTMPQIPFAPEKLISFEDAPLFDPQISKYGLDISDETELKDYILGGDGRTKPIFDDTAHPNIGNSVLYNQAQNVHQILDSWQPSPDTKVIQVAGWGVETLSGFDYKAYKDFLGNEKISYTPNLVVDGDQTVVVPSALWMSTTSPNVERWWVDLKKYNKNNIPDRVHRDILEVPSLRNLINYEIKDSVFTDAENIIVNNTSTLISSDSRLHFTLHSPLTLGITDSEGKYSGMDPTTKKVKQEIPDVDYRQIGEVQFLSVPAGIPYTLKLQGYAEGSFSLDIEKQTGNTVTDTFLFEGIHSFISTLATIDIGTSFDVLTSKLKVDENGDGSVDKIYPIVAEPPVTPPPAPPAGVAFVSHGGRVLPTIIKAYEQPKVEIKEIIQVAEATKPFDVAQGKEKVIAVTKKIIQEPKAENQEAVEIKIPEEIPLVASVVNSGPNNNWIWYVIILSILIIGFLFKKYYKLF